MLAAFSIVPIGNGEELKEDIAAILELIDKSGLPYKLGAMQTTVEGPEDEVMGLIMACHRQMRQRAGRVLTHITIDDRAGAANRLSGKVKDVEDILGKELRRE